MTTAKNEVFTELGYNMKIVIKWGDHTLVGGNKNLVGRSLQGEILPGEGE